MSLEDLAAVVRERFDDVLVARGEVTVVVDRDALLDALAWLREAPGVQMDFLSSVTATHWLDRTPAFWVDYELRSIPLRQRLRVKVGLAEGDAVVPSVTPMFPTANWHERETYRHVRHRLRRAPRPHADPVAGRLARPSRCARTSRSAAFPRGTWARTVPPIDERGMA